MSGRNGTRAGGKPGTQSGDRAGEPGSDWAAGAAFIDGEYVPVGQARVPVLDWGFTRSDATYDVVHVWRGSFFRLADHLDRFERSCRALRLDPGLSREELTEVLAGCVRRSRLRDAYVEMTCTRGQPPPGSRDPRQCRHRFLAFAVPFVWIIPPERQREGAHLAISPVRRIPPASLDPRVKNFHWGDMTRALLDGLDHGADTVVLVDLDGNLAEGPGFNVFAVCDGEVRSPGGTVLEGITRRTVQELCQELEVPFAIGPIRPEELRGADEAFLSSTAGGIMPVTRVDDARLGDGRPGPTTSRLRELYWAKHASGWHGTPVDYRA